MDLLNQDLTEFLENYLPEKFPKHKISGDDFMCHCIFCGGNNYKLGINLKSGLWNCFHGACGEKGNFTSLFAAIEGLSYSDASIKLIYKILLKEQIKPKDYRNLVNSYSVAEQSHEFIPIKPDTVLDNPVCEEAWFQLMDRKLFDFNDPNNNEFYYVMEGFYRNRLIIPYTYKGKMIYFQGRALLKDMKPKYLCATENTHKLRGVDVLYPFNLNEPYVVVCEGPIDARSLQLQGVNATCTTGTSISETQINALRSWGGRIILGYDNDPAGLQGIRKADRLRLRKMMPTMYICHPPSEFKDWNQAHMVGFNLKTYVEKNSFENTFEAKMTANLSAI